MIYHGNDDDDNDDDDDDDYKREKLISLWQLRAFCSRVPIGGGLRWHATSIDDHHHYRCRRRRHRHRPSHRHRHHFKSN